MTQYLLAATKNECINGNFESCKEIVNGYGRTTDKSGATEFFAAACASQNLKISCQIITSDKSETLKKTMDFYSKDSALFVMNGDKTDKIYKIVQVK
jgi:hypothetical protein